MNDTHRRDFGPVYQLKDVHPYQHLSDNNEDVTHLDCTPRCERRMVICFSERNRNEGICSENKYDNLRNASDVMVKESFPINFAESSVCFSIQLFQQPGFKNVDPKEGSRQPWLLKGLNRRMGRVLICSGEEIAWDVRSYASAWPYGSQVRNLKRKETSSEEFKNLFMKSELLMKTRQKGARKAWRGKYKAARAFDAAAPARPVPLYFHLALRYFVKSTWIRHLSHFINCPNFEGGRRCIFHHRTNLRKATLEERGYGEGAAVVGWSPILRK